MNSTITWQKEGRGMVGKTMFGSYEIMGCYDDDGKLHLSDNVSVYITDLSGEIQTLYFDDAKLSDAEKMNAVLVHLQNDYESFLREIVRVHYKYE